MIFHQSKRRINFLEPITCADRWGSGRSRTNGRAGIDPGGAGPTDTCLSVGLSKPDSLRERIVNPAEVNRPFLPSRSFCEHRNLRSRYRTGGAKDANVAPGRAGRGEAHDDAELQGAHEAAEERRRRFEEGGRRKETC